MFVPGLPFHVKVVAPEAVSVAASPAHTAVAVVATVRAGGATSVTVTLVFVLQVPSVDVTV